MVGELDWTPLENTGSEILEHVGTIRKHGAWHVVWMDVFRLHAMMRKVVTLSAAV